MVVEGPRREFHVEFDGGYVQSESEIVCITNKPMHVGNTKIQQYVY